MNQEKVTVVSNFESHVVFDYMKCRSIHNCRSMNPRGLWRKMFWNSEADIVGCLCYSLLRDHQTGPSHFQEILPNVYEQVINPENIRL